MNVEVDEDDASAAVELMADEELVDEGQMMEEDNDESDDSELNDAGEPQVAPAAPVPVPAPAEVPVPTPETAPPPVAKKEPRKPSGKTKDGTQKPSPKKPKKAAAGVKTVKHNKSPAASKKKSMASSTSPAKSSPALKAKPTVSKKKVVKSPNATSKHKTSPAKRKVISGTASSQPNKKGKTSSNEAALRPSDEIDAVAAAVVVEADTDSDDDDAGEVAVAVAVAAEVSDDSDDDDGVVTAKSKSETKSGLLTQRGKKVQPSDKARPTKKGAPKKAPSKQVKPGRGQLLSTIDDDDDAVPATAIIPSEKVEAAEAARSYLRKSVRRLPFPVSDTHLIRHMGRIKIEEGVPAIATQYSSPSALHPVGFCCDRYEFSPVHGRILRLRCDIVDGSKLPTGLIEDEESEEKKDDDGASLAAKKVTAGPLFRIMWGDGIDASTKSSRGEAEPSLPYDLSCSSAPIRDDDAEAKIVTVDGKEAATAPPSTASSTIRPEVGLRVSVRFDVKHWYAGTITKVTALDGTDATTKSGEKKKQAKKPRKFRIKILYDDGMPEEAEVPDPDIMLQFPGHDDMIAKSGKVELTELNDLAVTTVVGKTAIEAWGKALSKLGLVDEYISAAAIAALEGTRADAKSEAKGKMDGTRKGRDTRTRRQSTQSGRRSRESFDDDLDGKPDGQLWDEDMEAPSAQEQGLRKSLETALTNYNDAKQSYLDDAVDLGNARVAAVGSLLANPLANSDASHAQQVSWLAAVVRKEKAKMGSTGNKRKIVTPTDLLERNDTFFNAEMEQLIEGLPGSECCQGYVFHAMRVGGTAGNLAWIHEAKIKQEREMERQIQMKEEAQAKDAVHQERERKRQERDMERSKRQQAEDQKRKQREEERLSRLAMQVDDRLFKEACFQREKVVQVAAKTLGREFTRRRKAAEILSAHMVEQLSRLGSEEEARWHGVENDLPGSFDEFDVDVLRVWDFICSFSPLFKDCWGSDGPPSLDALQEAVNCLRNSETQSASSASSKDEKKRKKGAVELLTSVAVALSKPLVSGLAKSLATVVMSSAAVHDAPSNPEGAGSSDSPSAKEVSDAVVTFPVNRFTWREVARLALLGDALNDLHYSKQETAHLLRGYRSGGHPNSKEAKRLRRGEDYALVMLRQRLTEQADRYASSKNLHNTSYRVRMWIPCEPSATPQDWTFFLHNIKLLPASATTAIRTNARKALTLLKAEPNRPGGQKSVIVYELHKLICAVEELGSGSISSSENASRARMSFLELLEKEIDEPIVNDTHGKEVCYSDTFSRNKGGNRDCQRAERVWFRISRQNMGLVNTFRITSSDYRTVKSAKQEYITAVLHSKEEVERKKLRAADGEGDDDEDDDDEDEEDEGEDGESSSNKKKTNGETTDSSAAPKKPGNSEAEAVATVVEAKREDEVVVEGAKIGRETPYDDFCGDEPSAPELIRRCLAVLRAVAQTVPAEPFIQPVDPQSNTRYYDALMTPLCLKDLGEMLREAARLLTPSQSGSLKEGSSKESIWTKEVKGLNDEEVVATFARKFRTLVQNCACYSNVGAPIISSAEEMLRIFERLFFDWILVPPSLLPPLSLLDDDRCVEYHPSDEDAMVLLCDGCEGKFNMSRLEPPLEEVPQGDWYCPRCLSGRCWAHVDPRIGGRVTKADSNLVGVVKCCIFLSPEAEGNTRKRLVYDVHVEGGRCEVWTLDEVDEGMRSSGQSVPPISCLEALLESPGYGVGLDLGVYPELLPVPLNPSLSDNAAHAMVNNSVFRDLVLAGTSLRLCPTDDMKADEWLRILSLLVMKCGASDVVHEAASRMEQKAADRLSRRLAGLVRIRSIEDILPKVDGAEDSTNKSEGVEGTAGVEDGTDGAKKKQTPSLENADENDQVVEATASMDEKPDVTVSTVPREETSQGIVLDEGGAKAPLSEAISECVTSAGVENDSDMLPEVVLSEDDVWTRKRDAALAMKADRQKSREEGIMAHCISKHLQSVAASFEEDNLEQVIRSALAPKDESLRLQASSCARSTCKFCGLSDEALGTPLVRVSSDREWRELLPIAASGRRSTLVAEVESPPSLAKPDGGADEMNSKDNCRKVITVSVRVNDELFSFGEDVARQVDKIQDWGMLEFLPRNPKGFQDELRFRVEENIPFATGSWSAHECCAVAVHRARKDLLIQRHKENWTKISERDCATSCGRTVMLGADRRRRSFWQFHSDPSSLFVCESNDVSSPSRRRWCRFKDPEAIASVMASLGRELPCDELKRVFPKAASLLKERQWVYLLQRRNFSADLTRLAKELRDGKNMELDDDSPTEAVDPKESGDGESEEEELYAEGEHVLVESMCGKLLWDAVVIMVVRQQPSGKSHAYRVRYKNWSSRFDEYVAAERVVEPSENNVAVQEEMRDEMLQTVDGVPHSLRDLNAVKYLLAPSRAMGVYGRSINFHEALANVGPGLSSDDKLLGVLKAALLLVEAALPIGAVDISESGNWRPEMSASWRTMVKEAIGPASLMGCAVLLEDAIINDWLRPQASHLLSCLPRHWKAVNEATVSSISLRLWLLDAGIKYDSVYSPPPVSPPPPPPPPTGGRGRRSR